MIIAKPKDFRGTFRKLLRFMRPHWMGMTAIILLAGATTLASSLSPKIMGSATNEIVRGAQSLLEGGSGVDFGLLARILMLLMAVYVATSLLRYAQNYVMARREPAHHVRPASGCGPQAVPAAAGIL